MDFPHTLDEILVFIEIFVVKFVLRKVNRITDSVLRRVRELVNDWSQTIASFSTTTEEEEEEGETVQSVVIREKVS